MSVSASVAALRTVGSGADCDGALGVDESWPVAGSPTKVSPLSLKATTLGVGMTVGGSSDGDIERLTFPRLRKLRLMTVGRAGETIRLIDAQRDGFAQRLALFCEGKTYNVRLPLVGEFQASNALVAAGLAIATGEKPGDVMARLETLKGAKGRLEHAGTTATGAGRSSPSWKKRRKPSRSNVSKDCPTSDGWFQSKA